MVEAMINGKLRKGSLSLSLFSFSFSFKSTSYLDHDFSHDARCNGGKHTDTVVLCTQYEDDWDNVRIVSVVSDR